MPTDYSWAFCFVTLVYANNRENKFSNLIAFNFSKNLKHCDLYGFRNKINLWK